VLVPAVFDFQRAYLGPTTRRLLGPFLLEAASALATLVRAVQDRRLTHDPT